MFKLFWQIKQQLLLRGKVFKGFALAQLTCYIYFNTANYLAVRQLLECLFRLTWFKEFHQSSDSWRRQHKPGYSSKWCKNGPQFITSCVEGKILHYYDGLAPLSWGLTEEFIRRTTVYQFMIGGAMLHLQHLRRNSISHFIVLKVPVFIFVCISLLLYHPISF